MLSQESGWANLSFKELVKYAREAQASEEPPTVRYVATPGRVVSPACWSMWSGDDAYALMINSSVDPARPDELPAQVRFQNGLLGQERFLKKHEYLKKTADLYSMAQEVTASAKDALGARFKDVLEADLASSQLVKVSFEPGAWFGDKNMDSHQILNVCVRYQYRDENGPVTFDVYPFARRVQYGAAWYSAVSPENEKCICPDRPAMKD